MGLAASLRSLGQDLRFALRTLHRTPGPFVIAILALALGMGGATAVFSVVDRVLFRPLPYPAQERLVAFGMRAPIAPNEFLLETDYLQFQKSQQVLEAVTSMSRVGDCDLNEADPQRLACAQVAANFLAVLGVRPLIGNGFQAQHEIPGQPRAAMLAHGFWQSRFGGDRGVIGRQLIIDGRLTEITGVLPANFELPNLARVDILLSQQLVFGQRIGVTLLSAYGRLRPGVMVQQARAALEPLFQDSLQRVPAGFRKEVTFHVASLRERQSRDYRASSFALLGSVAALLLIACANVANLLLARGTARRHEFAVRSALGASRTRLLRQLLTESLLLAVMGGLAGTAFAAVFLRVLVALAPQEMVRVHGASLDLRVLVFTAIICLGCGLACGVIPAFHSARKEDLAAPRTTGHRWAASHALLALQIGLSVVLLTGAGLLLKTLWQLNRVPLGMTPEQVLTVRVQLGQRYSTGALQSLFLEQAFERLQSIPGASYVAMADTVPLYGPAGAMIFSNIEMQGRPYDATRQTGGMTVARWVTPSYFSVLGIGIVRGRSFIESDRLAREDYVIVDEPLARRLFGNEDPIGKQIRPGVNGPWRTILGVARKAKNANLSGADDPEYYYLWRRTPEHGRRHAHFLIRSDADPTELASFVRGQFAHLDPALPLTITTMEENVGRHIERPRFQASLFGAFALIGVVLAAVGQFGLISYTVSQRAAEIGLRMALGAKRGDVLRLILRRTLLWTGIGAVAGTVAALALSSKIEPLLYGAKARDATSLIIVLALLVGISVIAAWRPAARAIRIDPARTLHHE